MDSYKGTVKEFLQQLKLVPGTQHLMYKVKVCCITVVHMVLAVGVSAVAL